MRAAVHRLSEVAGHPHAGPAGARPKLTKLPFAIGPNAMENTPVIFGGRPLLVLNRRDDTKNQTDDYTRSMYLYVRDLTTGKVSSFAGDAVHILLDAGLNALKEH